MRVRAHRRLRSGRRRKTLWSESNLGLVSAALANTSVAVGWMAFPAGQYDFQFTPPAFQPEDLTHVRSLFSVGWSCSNQPSAARASGWSIGFGVLPFDAQDGNAYQGVLVATTGIGSVPNPASNDSFDWIWKRRDLGDSQHAGGITAFFAEVSKVTDEQTRAMRKLSHGAGLLFCIGWDWLNPTFSQNGDTFNIAADITARSIYKEA